MKGRYVLALGSIPAILLACEAWIHTSASHAACASGEVHAGPSVFEADLPLLWLFGAMVLTWAARTLWLLTISSLASRRLPRLDWCPDLHDAVRRTSVQRVESLDSAVPYAFCAGVLRPSIFVTKDLVLRLRPQELDAVLLHEEHHRRRRDPLRYLLRRSAADALFFVPVVRWWADYAGQSAELSADRTVLTHLGPAPLAGALWRVSSEPSVSPGFQGAAELRVAQLLGDHVQRRMTPTPRIVLASLGGLLLALQLTWCLSVAAGILQNAGL